MLRSTPLFFVGDMIRFFLFLFCLPFSFGLFAQIQIGFKTLPGIGDTLYLGLDNLPEGMTLGTTGGPQTWDFSTLQAPFSKPLFYKKAKSSKGAHQFPLATMSAALYDGPGTGFYIRTKTALELVGTFGQDPLGLGLPLAIQYYPPLPDRHGRLRYQESFREKSEAKVTFDADDVGRSILDSLPISPDSFRLRITIDRKELVDGYGTVILPSGQYNALRLRRLDRFKIRLDAKLPFVDWKDVTELLPAKSPLGEQEKLTYFFLSEEEKTPIAIVDAHPRTEAMQSVQFLQPKARTAASSQFFSEPGLYAYPNPAILEVRFDFKNLDPGFYDIRIFNILGVEVWSENYWVPGNRTVKVDLAPFSKGTYLYSIVNAEGKTLSTKRLVIVRP